MILLLCCMVMLRIACCASIATAKPNDFIDDRLGVRKIRVSSGLNEAF